VVAAVDRSAASAGAVEWLRALRTAVPCQVTYVHLYWPAEQYTRLGLVGWRSMMRPDPTTIGVLEHELSTVLGEEGHGAKLRVLPTWGAPGDHLAADAQALGADLLVMGTRQKRGLRRLWLGSAVHGTLRAATLPVLCVPARPHGPRREPVPEIHRVLVPTDLSDLANRAIPQAYALARGARGTVHLCLVHEGPLPSPVYAYDRKAGEVLSKKDKDAIAAALLDLVPEDAEALGVETALEIIDGGEPATAICQAANRLSVDAICLASHGRGGLGKALLGSVAAKVVQHAEQPVHIVRTPRS
jgi:nucleotide-binding universal stress UspA family protein